MRVPTQAGDDDEFDDRIGVARALVVLRVAVRRGAHELYVWKLAMPPKVPQRRDARPASVGQLHWTTDLIDGQVVGSIFFRGLATAL